jgi:colicin import membrane protein
MASQETSALFSLGELMRLEQDRIAQEEADRRARALADELARRDAEQRAREEELARIQLEQDRQRAEAEREREQTARLEAIRLAEVERARIEAEQRGRLDALSAQQQHDQKIKALETDASKKRLSRALRATLALSAALIAGGLSFYWFRVRPATQNQVASLESIIADQRQVTETTKRALDEQNLKLGELENRMRHEQQERQDAERAKADADTKAKAKTPIVPVRRNVKPPPAAEAPCVCADPHDPLCGCFKH